MTCQHCSTNIIVTTPEGDTHERKVCGNCNTILYENPKIVAVFYPYLKIRFCYVNAISNRRKHFWTVPSGFMELNETLKEAALREAKEEAGIEPTIDHLHTIYDLPHIGQVYFLFKAHCDTPDHEPGIETIESKWVTYNNIPWDELAFTSVEFGLRHFHSEGPHYGKYKSKH